MPDVTDFNETRSKSDFSKKFFDSLENMDFGNLFKSIADNASSFLFGPEAARRKADRIKLDMDTKALMYVENLTQGTKKLNEIEEGMTLDDLQRIQEHAMKKGYIDAPTLVNFNRWVKSGARPDQKPLMPQERDHKNQDLTVAPKPYGP